MHSLKQTQLIMGMPITVEIVGGVDEQVLDDVFGYFRDVDQRFSTYKKDSEISRINAGLPESQWSDDMRHVLALCEQTRQETQGFFDIMRDGRRDPSGLVKGWAIQQAAEQLHRRGVSDFYIDAGGDIQTSGYNSAGKPWTIGIRNPFNQDEIVKRLGLTTEGVATSGTYIRGQHIYNPHLSDEISDIQSLTVVGLNIYEADRFATAAFAMGKEGIVFIENRSGLEGYMIADDKTATYTSGFERYVV